MIVQVAQYHSSHGPNVPTQLSRGKKLIGKLTKAGLRKSMLKRQLGCRKINDTRDHLNEAYDLVNKVEQLVD